MKNVYIIVFSLVVIGALGYFVITREPSEPAPAEKEVVSSESAVSMYDWQIYQNEEYGFEFQYPNTNEWKVIKTDGFDDSLFFFLYEKGGQSISLSLHPNLTTEQNIAYWEKNGLQSVEPFQIKNITGEKLVVRPRTSTYSFIYLFNGVDGLLYSLGIFGVPGENELVNMFERVVSTFRFTESD
tara:strand:- start:8 stop:559 length:552 start_codon:yes stop_codon:yes gene_type:complete